MKKLIILLLISSCFINSCFGYFYCVDPITGNKWVWYEDEERWDLVSSQRDCFAKNQEGRRECYRNTGCVTRSQAATNAKRDYSDWLDPREELYQDYIK